MARRLLRTIAEGERIDWSAIRDRIDVAAITTALLGRAPGRRGAKGRYLWWVCPFHDDKNPSLCVDPRERRWICFGCDEHGDAAALVMRVKGWPFPEAVAWLAEQTGIVTPTGQGKLNHPRPPAAKPSAATIAARPKHSGLPPSHASTLVALAEVSLWTTNGSAARKYLNGRRLTDETIRSARLGWTDQAVGLPWKPPGIVIPWFSRDRLTLVKIRPTDQWRARFPEDKRPPKYIEAFRDRPRVYPGLQAIRPSTSMISVEGELDCLLLAQLLADLDVSVVTLGSASNRPALPILAEMLTSPAWYVAHDSDAAGDRAAACWPPSARRVRPPAPYKDWTDAHQAGVDLRRWWTDRLAGIDAPELFTWAELARARWGPAKGDPTPGIVIR